MLASGGNTSIHQLEVLFIQVSLPIVGITWLPLDDWHDRVLLPDI